MNYKDEGMKNKTIFQISFGLFVMSTVFWLLQMTETYFSNWSNNTIEFAYILGTVLFAVGISQLNQSTLIPASILIITHLIGGLVYIISTLGMYSLPFGVIGWTLYSVLIYYLPVLLFLIFLKTINKDDRINDKILISIIFTGIALILRILRPIISENLYLLPSENYPNILNILSYIGYLSSNGGLLLAVGSFMSSDIAFFDSTKSPSVQSPKPIIDINKKMTVGDWLITYLILSLPIVNVIMLFIWAFGSNVNIHKHTWAKALLIWFAIIMALYFLFFIIIFGILFS